MSWSWFLRDFLNIGVVISTLYLICFEFIPFKFKRWEDWKEEFKERYFGPAHIAIAILALRGAVWLFDRYFQR